jgi:hypothetical protein
VLRPKRRAKYTAKINTNPAMTLPNTISNQLLACDRASNVTAFVPKVAGFYPWIIL